MLPMYKFFKSAYLMCLVSSVLCIRSFLNATISLYKFLVVY